MVSRKPLAQGSRGNKFADFALRFRPDLADPIERNRKNNSQHYFEDFVIEDRSKMG